MRHTALVIVWAGVNASLLWESHFAGGYPWLCAAIAGLLLVNAVLYRFADRILLTRYDAREATGAEYAELRRTIQAMARRLRMPTPRLYVVADPSLKAFVARLSSETCVLAVSDSLVRRLTPAELDPVLLHELAHIRKRQPGVRAVVTRISRAFGDLASMAIWTSGGERREARRLRAAQVENEVRCFSTGCGARI